jgi:hypothetical protein
MKVIKTNGEMDVEFEEPPKIETRADALKILDLLIEADYVKNDRLALEALRAAIKKGIT